MAIVDAANQVVRDAEVRLRELMERAISEQRYADVAEVAHLADGLSRLIDGQPHRPIPSSSRPSQAAKKSEVCLTGKPKVRNRKTSKSRSGKTPKQYPRFERDGDRLVKIGWSKKSKAEYEHRAPRQAVLAFVRHLAATVPVGTIFTVEDLLPTRDSTGSEVPGYQIYLTMAWLRHATVVERKGRDGYVLRDDSLMDGTLDHLWDQLPVRSI